MNNGIGTPPHIERLHDALANGARVVANPRDICEGRIYSAMKKHDPRTVLAAAAWSVWGRIEYRAPWLLRVGDRVSSAFPGSTARKWQNLREYRFNGSAHARDALDRGAALVVMSKKELMTNVSCV